MSIILSLITCLNLSSMAAPSTSPMPTTSPTNISIGESTSAQYPINPDDKKKLLKEYERAISASEKALDHQERSAMRELSAAQSMRAREWREKEKQARRAYFEKFSSGPDRRQYVQDFVARKKQFDKSLKDETVTNRKSWREKKDQLKGKHKQDLIQFKAQLEENKRPDASLWPQAH